MRSYLISLDHARRQAMDSAVRQQRRAHVVRSLDDEYVLTSRQTRNNTLVVRDKRR